MNMIKDNNIAVSVIVPIYNVEEYLKACLESLERQTLQNIEVILVNDGSTDGSENIARQYVDRYKKFSLIDRENGGLSAARNSGIKNATGKYIYFLDSDDYLIDTALERMYQKAEEENLDVLKFSAYNFEDGKDAERVWETYKYEGEYPDVYTGVELLNRMRCNGDNGIVSCDLIFTRRNIIRENSLEFYEGIIHEDNLFHWQLLAVCKRVRVLNEPLYCRRNRQGSITGTPQYYNKWRSLVLSTLAADDFFHKHGELKGTGIDRDYYSFLYWGIKLGYLQMDKKLRKTQEARQLHRIERKLLLKWHAQFGMDMLLYIVHPDFSLLYEIIRNKIFHI